MGERCSRLEANFPDEDYNDNFHVLNDEEEEAFKQFEEEQKKLVGDYSSNDTGYDSYNLYVIFAFQIIINIEGQCLGLGLKFVS